MFNVLIETGNRDPREVRCLHRECGIGRGDGNLVMLQGWNIGSRHAALRRMDEGIFIESLGGGRAAVLVNGETIVISGLTDINAAKSADKFPILGEIPILGRLFRSDRFRANQTDLVVFVTPRIVGPNSQHNRDGLEQARRIREIYESDLGRKLGQ